MLRHIKSIFIALLACSLPLFNISVSGAVEHGFPQTIDLSSSFDGIVKIFGNDESDKAGIGVATGDINGDGYYDIIIGARWADPLGRIRAGNVYIYFGSSHTFSNNVIDLSASPSGILTLSGEQEGDCFGESVSTGDVNGDGYDDVIIGAYEAKTDTEDNTGKTYIIFGTEHLASLSHVDLRKPSIDVVTLIGEDPGDQFGFSTTTGDINNDGYDDIIIGAMTSDPLDRINAGTTYILKGFSDFPSYNTFNINDITSGLIKIYGEDPGDWSGIGLAAGDVNGNGFDDVIIGAWFADIEGEADANGDAGITYLLAGSADIFSIGEIDLKNPVLTVTAIHGERSLDYSGAEVAVGDINMDGFDDIVIGAHGYDSEIMTENGCVYIVTGTSDITESGIIHLKDSSPGIIRIIGKAHRDHLSRGIIEDINKDGINDLIVASADADPFGKAKAGEVYILFGESVTDRDVIYLDIPPSDMVTILGDDVDGHLGFVLSAGDVNYDGYDDFIIGAHDSSPNNKHQAGKVYIISGAGVYERFEDGTHFLPTINTGNNSTILILSDSPPKIFGEVIARSDEIGVFTPNGLCAGAGIWNGRNLAITVWGDDSLKDGINGFLPGELYIFKIWDVSEGKEYNVNASYLDGTGTYTVDGIIIINSLETILIDFTIRLHSGWNAISSIVYPLEPSMDSIMGGNENLVIVKNGKGQVYWPLYGINQIGNWEITDGYQIYVNEADNLVISGFEILPMDVTYHLIKDWNLISFIGEKGIDPSTAFNSIIDKIIIVKDGSGNTFWPEYEIDQIESMEQGKGYWIDLTQPVVFSYHGSVEKALPKLSGANIEPPHFKPVRYTGNNSTILIRKDIKTVIDGVLLTPGDEIGIFSSQEFCFGAGLWDGNNLAITVWGDNAQTKEVDGMQTGEMYKFRIWDSESQTEYNSVATYASDEPLFVPDDLVIVESLVGEHVIVTIDKGNKPQEFALSQNYPNPFNAVTSINFSLPHSCHVKLKIYNSLGEEIETLTDTEYSHGSYTIEWDASKFSSGIYFYNLEADSFGQTRKLLFLK